MTIKNSALKIEYILFIVFLLASQKSFCLPVGSSGGTSLSSSDIDLPASRFMTPGQEMILSTKPSRISLGLAWDPPSDETYVDIDLNLHVIKSSRTIASIVWYHQRKFRSSWLFGRRSCIEHTYDSITGDGEGDNERIQINLRRLHLFQRRVTHLVASLTCYSKHWIEEVNEAVLRLNIVEKDGASTEIAKIRLADCDLRAANGSKRGQKACLLLILTKGKHGVWTAKMTGVALKLNDHEQSVIAQDCDQEIFKLLRSNELDI